MKKRLILLFAAVLLAMPLGANVAMADGGGNSNDTPGDTGNACPENSPQGADEDPSCGQEGKGKSDEDKGNNGQGNADKGNAGQDNSEEHGEACPPASPDADGDGEPACGAGDDAEGGEEDGEIPANETDCADGVDNDEDGLTDGEDPDCEEAPATETECADGVDNDEDGAIDGDDSDCQAGATNVCTAEAGDPGILTEDTLGQTLFDEGLSAASPLVEDPEADGAISKELHNGGNGTDAEPLTDELACALDLAIDPETGLPDL